MYQVPQQTPPTYDAMPPVQSPMQAPVQVPKAPNNADLERYSPPLFGRDHLNVDERDERFNVPNNIKEIKG